MPAKQGHSARAMRLRRLEDATNFPPEALSMLLDKVSAAVAAHAADVRARRGLQQTRCDDVDEGDLRSSARAEQRADPEMKSPKRDCATTSIVRDFAKGGGWSQKIQKNSTSTR